jgi:hypothetical protein
MNNTKKSFIVGHVSQLYELERKKMVTLVFQGDYVVYQIVTRTVNIEYRQEVIEELSSQYKLLREFYWDLEVSK